MVRFGLEEFGLFRTSSRRARVLAIIPDEGVARAPRPDRPDVDPPESPRHTFEAISIRRRR